MPKDNRRARNRRLVAEYKRGKACVNCNKVRPLTYHHRDPSKKLFALSKASRLKVSLDALKREIAKCVLLCEDCHRLEHEDYFIVPDELPTKDFHCSSLTNGSNCVIILHEPTGTKVCECHGTSRRLAHNKAWTKIWNKVKWYYDKNSTN
jgi:hypothetical protein